MKRWLIVLCLLSVTVSSAWAGATAHLTILHTNDLHGMMMPFDYTGNTAYTQRNAGGLARRAHLIQQVRNSTSYPVVVVDAGDLFTRGPWHTKFLGTPEIRALNYMGYDMMCVGNNEFKATQGTDSQAIMLGLMRRSDFPWLGSNLTVGGTGVPVEGIHPFIVRDLGDIRVGFLGLTAPRSKDYPQTAGWTISDPIEAAKKWVPTARKECDVLIAITHIGYLLDGVLAASVPGIDAVVGGDSHTFIPSAQTAKGPDGREVPVVQAGEYGVVLGRLDLTFEKKDDWRLIKAESRLIPIDSSMPEDRKLKGLLYRWLHPKPEPKPAADTHSWYPAPIREMVFSGGYQGRFAALAA